MLRMLRMLFYGFLDCTVVAPYQPPPEIYIIIDF